jgi:sensor histidine kinase YesM
MTKKLILLSVFVLSITSIYSASPFIIKDQNAISFIGKHIYLLEDPTNEFSFQKIINSKNFVKSNDNVPNLGVDKIYWGKFQLINETDDEEFQLVLSAPIIDEVIFYYQDKTGKYIEQLSGDNFKLSIRKIKHQDHIYNIILSKNQPTTFYFKIKSDEDILIPFYIGKANLINEELMTKDVLCGIFFGILIVMFLYNFFLYLTIRDVNFLYYLLYVFFIGLTQASVLGYTTRYIFPDSPILANQTMLASLIMASITVIYFAFSFMNVEYYYPKLKELKYFLTLILLLALPFTFFGHQDLATKITDFCAVVFCPLLMIIAIVTSLKGERSSIFFIAGWLLALIGFSIFAMKNFGLLPFNDLTNHTMQLGIALETIIFSFALADRITILKKENDEKQKLIIQHLKENEKHLIAAKKAEVLVETLKKETLISQFESLKTQVNPHFLFNSLNVLTELIYKNQPTAAKFVKELSEVYRYVLDSKSKEVVNLSSELKFVDAFTYLLKIRFAGGLVIHNKLQGSMNEAVPPLAIQLLLENAIKHNIISEKDPLQIDLFQEEDYLIVKNKINRKKSTEAKSGIGIPNLEKRYTFLTDKKVVINEQSGYFIAKIPILYFSYS